MGTDKNKPIVSIVVPCRNGADQIETALRSILAQETPPGGFEVIVADGMSADGTHSILSALAKENSLLRIVDNPGGIVSTGLNAAIRLARGKIIIRMDAHTTYDKNYVLQCVQVLQESGADNVGGPWVAVGKGKTGKAIAAAFQSSFAMGGARVTILSIPAASIRFILVAGPVMFSIASECLTKNLCETKMTSLI